MPKLQLSHRRRGARWLALGVAATVIGLPGIANADPLSDPGSVVAPGSVPDPVGGVIDQVTGQSSQSNGSTSSDSSAPQQQAATQDSTTSGTPAPPTLPPQLQQLLAQLQSQSPNPACSAAIQADLTKLATDIPAFLTSVVDYIKGQLTSGSPPTPQQILDQLQGLLGQLQGQQPAGAAASSPPPDPTVIQADLQQLVTDLTTKCLTAPTPPSSSSNPPPSNPQPPAQGVSEPQPAQPVSYPGYAPTGSIATTALRPASDQRSSDPVPLSALAAVLLVSSATAVGVRSRARRAGR